MAPPSPQCENGFTRIANELCEALARLQLSGNQWRVLWVILRETFGWQRKLAQISVTKFQQRTGLDRRHVARALTVLTARKIVAKNGNSFITTYGINKDYSQWKSLPKLATNPTVAKNGNSTIAKIGNETIAKNGNTINKEETSKEMSGFQNPTPRLPVKEIVHHLNQKAGTHYRVSSKKTRALIHARFRDGFVLADFLRVIDTKSAKWGPDPKMCAYLRPETLFGSKFEAYLNEPPGNGTRPPAPTSSSPKVITADDVEALYAD